MPLYKLTGRLRLRIQDPDSGGYVEMREGEEIEISEGLAEYFEREGYSWVEKVGSKPKPKPEPTPEKKPEKPKPEKATESPRTKPRRAWRKK